MSRVSATTVGYPFIFMLIAVSSLEKSSKIAMGILLCLAAIIVIVVSYVAKRDLSTVACAVVAASLACFIFAAAEQGNTNAAVTETEQSTYITGTVVEEPRYNGKYEYVIETDDGFRFVFTSNRLDNGQLYSCFEGNVVLYSRTSVADRAYYYAYAEDDFECTFRDSDGTKLTGALSFVRSWSAERINDISAGETAEYLKGVIIGDGTAIGKSLAYKFRVTGLAHVLVVSGSHLTTVLMLITTMLTLGHGRKRIYYISALLIMLAYMALTGFGASVVRAGISGAVLGAGFIISRDADAVNSLGTAALLTGIADPYTAVSLGFQLSFFSTLGIITLGLYLSRRINKYRLPKLVRLTLNAVVLTLSAQLFTLPVLIPIYSELSPVAIMANLLTSWAVGVSVACGVIYLLLSAVFLYPVALPFGFISDVSAKYCIGVADTFCTLPFAYVKIPRMTFAVCIFTVVIAVALFIFFGRRTALPVALAVCTCAAVLVGSTVYCNRCIRITSVCDGCVIVSYKGDAVIVGCGDSIYELRRITYALADIGVDNVGLIVGRNQSDSSLVAAVHEIDTDAVIAETTERLSRACANGVSIIDPDSTASPFDGCTVTSHEQYTIVRIGELSIASVNEYGALPENEKVTLMLCDNGTSGSANIAIIPWQANPLAICADRVYNANDDGFSLTLSTGGRIISVE